jgi:uncharacterized protein
MAYDDDQVSSDSNNTALEQLVAKAVSRRKVLAGGLGTAGLMFLGCGDGETLDGDVGLTQQPLIGFKGVPVTSADTVVVPEGYSAEVLFAWGDPISSGPAFAHDASNTALDQEIQAGMHHDALHFFPFDGGGRGRASRRGLLVINHEYTDDGLLHVGGMTPWTAEKVKKSQAAHGVSVIEVEFTGKRA